MAKLKKPAVILDEIATDILKEAEHWVDLYRNGGGRSFLAGRNKPELNQKPYYLL